MSGRHGQPCPKCGSGDARSLYPDGSTYCFSSKHVGRRDTQPIKQAEELMEFEDVANLPIRALDSRGINLDTARRYGVRCGVDPVTGDPASYYFPLYVDGKLVGYQGKRVRPPGGRQKGDTIRVGGSKGCSPFGAQVGRGGRLVIVVEGAEDCLAATQMLAAEGKNYRVVATLGTEGWRRTLEYFEQFEKVAIAYDQDEPGRAAANEFAAALSPGKAVVMQWDGAHDPNDLLKNGKSGAFIDALNNASCPKVGGIIYGEEAWSVIENYSAPKSVPYPPEFSALNDKIGGMRAGEISLWTSGSGSGKSAFLRRIKQHVIQNTTWRVGDVELEESKEKTIRAMLQYQGKKRLSEMTMKEKRSAHDATYGTNRLFTVDRRSRLSKGASLLGQLKHLRHGMGCDIIMLDHITLAQDELGDGREGLAAQDKMMADLLELVESTGVHISLISHLRKTTSGGKSFEEGAMPALDDIKGCLDADSEYLSPSGWRRIADYDGGLVGQWCDGVLQYVPAEFVKLPATEPLYHFTDSNNIDMMLSPEHRMLLDGEVRLAKNVALAPGRAEVPVLWTVGGEGLGLSALDIQLMVMSAADGCYDRSGVKLELKKERKIERARSILSASSLPFKERTTKRGTTVFTYPRPAHPKALHLTADWYAANSKELAVLLGEVMHWDGRRHPTSGDYFASDKEGEADVVQWAAHSCGLVARKRVHGKHFQVSVSRHGSQKNRVFLRGGYLAVNRCESLDGYKYCFSVPSSFFVARRNGRVFVTGNSGSVKQISFDIITLGRNMQHPDPYLQNVSQLRVLKNREYGNNGDADRLHYDKDTFTLSPATEQAAVNEQEF